MEGLCDELESPMKLVSFQINSPIGVFTRVGAWHDHSIVDLNMAYARLLADRREAQPRRLADAQVPATMLEFLEGGTSTIAAAALAFDHAVSLGSSARGSNGETIVHDPAAVRLTAPLPNPPSLRDFIAFEDHIAATSKRRGQPIPPEWYKMPVYYKGNHRTIIGPDETLSWPLETTKLDYELELACVVGRKGRDIPEQQAEHYIAGYTICGSSWGLIWAASPYRMKPPSVSFGICWKPTTWANSSLRGSARIWLPTG